MTDAPQIRTLLPADAPALQALRLEALSTAPEAFASSYEEEAPFSLDKVRARMPAPDAANAIFGAFAHERLVGMAGFYVSEKLKQRHKGTLWGVFVQPPWRRRGLGEALVRRVVAHAAAHVLLLAATTAMTNEAARRLYRRLGFVPFGIEPKALRVGGAFYDEELLVLELDRQDRASAR